MCGKEQSDIVAGASPASVLFLNSPSRFYDHDKRNNGERSLTPYGIATVASSVEKDLGLEQVAMVDCELSGLSPDKILSLVAEVTEGKGVVGMNVLTPTLPITLFLGRQIVKNYPDIKLVFGGPHATLDPKSILEVVPEAIVVRGDGVGPMTKIVEGTPLKQIGGIVYTDRGKLVFNGPPNVAPIDSIPNLDRRLVSNEPYPKSGKETMTMITSFGCRGNCAFCITPAQYAAMKEGGAKRIRFRDMESVIKEIVQLRTDYNEVAHIQFLDDEMFPNLRRADDFIKRWVEYGLDDCMSFSCLLRPDIVAKLHESGRLLNLKQAGLTRISMGIETGYNRGRIMVSNLPNDRIDPKYDPPTVVKAVQVCSSVGIDTKGFFIIGLPTETRKETNETIDYLMALRNAGLNEAAVFPLKVYPGTHFWDIAISLGFKPEQLGKYDAPSVSQLIASGMDPVTASRDTYSNSVQLAEIPPEELQELCQYHMNNHV